MQINDSVDVDDDDEFNVDQDDEKVLNYIFLPKCLFCVIIQVKIVPKIKIAHSTS